MNRKAEAIGAETFFNKNFCKSWSSENFRRPTARTGLYVTSPGTVGQTKKTLLGEPPLMGDN